MSRMIALLLREDVAAAHCLYKVHEVARTVLESHTMNRSGLIELEAVVAVARRSGFRAAARDLGMSSSALSHAVASLESRLGVRLFDRTTRSVAVSAAGEQFI